MKEAGSLSISASDTDPRELEWFSINEDISSGSLLPVVSMMQATDARERNQTRRLAWLGSNRAHRWRVFFKRVVDSIRVIIGDVLPDQTTQVNVIEHDHVIEKLSSAASDPAFRDECRHVRLHEAVPKVEMTAVPVHLFGLQAGWNPPAVSLLALRAEKGDFAKDHAPAGGITGSHATTSQ